VVEVANFCFGELVIKWSTWFLFAIIAPLCRSLFTIAPSLFSISWYLITILRLSKNSFDCVENLNFDLSFQNSSQCLLTISRIAFGVLLGRLYICEARLVKRFIIFLAGDKAMITIFRFVK